MIETISRETAEIVSFQVNLKITSNNFSMVKGLIRTSLHPAFIALSCSSLLFPAVCAIMGISPVRLPYFSGNFCPFHIRQLNIHKDQIRLPAAESFNASEPVAGMNHIALCKHEKLVQIEKAHIIILNDQYGFIFQIWEGHKEPYR